jgi:putative tricarboxylic transport membrane protein
MQTLWLPDGPLEIVAGTPPGGGLDRTARALQKAIDVEHFVEVPLTVRNVPGDGARKAWAYMDTHRGNPRVVSISHPNLTSDRLVGLADFDHRSYTAIAMLYTEYIAFVVRSDSALRNGEDLLQRLGTDAPGICVALSTALGNPNHIALGRLALHAGADPKALLIRVFDSAVDAIADVISGKAQLAAVTAASAIAALGSGEARVLGVSAPERLPGVLRTVPTWREQSVDCVVGAWRGIAGAAGIGESHVEYWVRTLAAATATDTWLSDLERQGVSPCLTTGAALHDFLERERSDTATALKALGLLRAAPA